MFHGLTNSAVNGNRFHVALSSTLAAVDNYDATFDEDKNVGEVLPVYTSRF